MKNIIERLNHEYDIIKITGYLKTDHIIFYFGLWHIILHRLSRMSFFLCILMDLTRGILVI